MIDEAAGWAWQAFARFADFDGRSHRREVLSFAGVNAVVTALAVTASAWLGARAGLSWVASGTVVAVYLAVLFIPSVALVARRLHDTGRSSLWLGLGLVPVVGLVVVYWLLLPGERGPNRYGPDPRTRVLGEYDRI